LNPGWAAIPATLLLSGCGAPTQKVYVSGQEQVQLQVPRTWTSPIEEGPDRGLSGPDGYVKLSAMAGSPTVEDACRADAFHRMRPYGPNPRVERVTIDGQPGCRIVPTIPDAASARIPAGLILQYPKPVWIEPRYVHTRPYPYLVVWTDPPHLPMIERSLRFQR
jgi:TolB protein